MSQLESLIPEPEQQEQDTEVQDSAENIRRAANAAWDVVLNRCERRLAAEMAPLESEREDLEKERDTIAKTASDLRELLPAKARVAQYEADVLTVAGKHEEAREKIAEHQAAVQAPDIMAQRQIEISARIEAIEGERKATCRRAYEMWRSELQQVIRPTEHGLFIDLLNRAVNEMEAFEQRHGLGATLDNPYGGLVKEWHISSLTADGNSDEWRSATHWYRSRSSR